MTSASSGRQLPRKGRPDVQTRTDPENSLRGHDAEFQGLIAQLLDTMRQELRQNRRLLDVVRQRKGARLGQTGATVDSLLRAERELLSNAVTVERDRISLLTELGQLLGHPSPSRLRVAEIILHSSPENRDDLLDLRDEFRDVADELDDLNSVEPLFARQRRERIRLYVTPSRSAVLLEEGVRPLSRRAESAHSLRPREKS